MTESPKSSAEMSLSGSVAMVTGATQAIGHATALRLASEGAHVVCADIQDADGTVKTIESAGGSAESVWVDVRSGQAWTDAVQQVRGSHSRIDYLANVAGVVNTLTEDSVTGLTEEAWDHVVNTDLKGPWLGMRAVIPDMIDNGGGRIVNISSLAALRGCRISRHTPRPRVGSPHSLAKRPSNTASRTF